MANDGIDVDLLPGEIHALLGANGAGKTTLMSILAGVYSLDAGTVCVRGRPVRFQSPADALRAGIGMVHQHVKLVPSMTVAENLALGDRRIPWRLWHRALEDRIRGLAHRLGFELDPGARVGDLPLAAQQQVEILRNLVREVAVLILDEPTALATPQEAEGLFATMRTLAREGTCIVFISHKLDEVMAVADRATVLRDGRVVFQGTIGTCDATALVEAMVGAQERPVAAVAAAPLAGEPAMELVGVWAQDERGAPTLRGVGVRISPGEILGVVGLAGAGQEALAEVATGLVHPVRGGVIVGGEDLTGAPVRDFLRRGVRYVPGDRCGRGLALDLSVGENAILTWLHHPSLERGPFLSRRRVGRWGREVASSQGIEPPDPWRPVRLLSGGSMQQLIVGRETFEAPRVLIAEYPLRGLDVRAARFVRERLRALASGGAAILFISEDVDDLLQLSHRILVMARGRVVAERFPECTSRLQLGMDMLGVAAP